MRAGLLVLALCVAGCSRLGFRLPLRSDAAADGVRAPDAPARADAALEGRRPEKGADGGCRLGPWSKPVRIDEVSAVGDDDWYPAISPDGLTLVFHSWRLGGLGSSDLWQATRKSPSGSFSSPLNLAVLSSSAPDERPAFGPDGRTLYFSSSRTSDDDIRISTRDASGKWGPPVLLNAPPFPGYDEVGGVSPDGNTLYITGWEDPALSIFKRSRPGAGAPFGPMQLVPELSTAGNEEIGALSSDGLEIYLYSTRPGGKGKLDIWVARRATLDAPFSTPSNVAELNTPEDDLVGSISADGRTLYVTVGTSTKGGLDADLSLSTRTCLP